MDVYLMIQRKKLTIFTDTKDDATILEVKKIIEGITNVSTDRQKLFTKEYITMEDDKTLAAYNYTPDVARAQTPGFIGLAIKQENEEFEELDLEAYSTPPDLPAVMRNGDES